MKTTDEQLLHILLKDTRNPHRIAQTMCKPVSEIRAYMREHELDYLPGWGRVRIQKDIISRRRWNAEAWPRADAETVEVHRCQHDSGHVNMCHGRDGDFILLYAQHNNPPVKGRRPYFMELS